MQLDDHQGALANYGKAIDPYALQHASARGAAKMAIGDRRDAQENQNNG